MRSKTRTDSARLQLHQMLPPIMSILLSVPLGNESSLAASKISTFDLRRKASDMLGTLMKTYGPDYETLIPRTYRLSTHLSFATYQSLDLHHRSYSNAAESTCLAGIVQIYHANRHPRHKTGRLLSRPVPRCTARSRGDQ